MDTLIYIVRSVISILIYLKVSSYHPGNSTCVVPDPRLTDEINLNCSKYQNLQDDIVTTNLYDPGAYA